MTNLPFTQPPTDPSLKDVLDKLKQDIFLSLNCHHLGTIQSFDSAKQTAVVTINYKKTYYKYDSTSRTYKPTLVDYPIIADCPVIFLGGGAAHLTFPVAVGDECLILFNDRDIDNWFKGGNNTSVASPRLHSFADAIALVGINSLGKVISNFDGTRAALINGTTYVAVSPTLIKIANASTTLNTLLQDLITNIKNLVTATSNITVTAVTPGLGASGVPVNAATITAINTTLTALAGQIGGLLE